MIEPTPELIEALKLAKAQCVIRVVQLSHCRVCGDDQARFDRATKQLDQLINQLETSHVQTVAAQP